MKKLINILLATVLTVSFSVTTFAHEYAMSFLFGGTTTLYNKYVDNTGNVLNTVSPSYFDIYTDGTLNSTNLDTNFINSMHAKNLKVTPFLSNHWDRALGVKALENYEQLTTQIAEIIYSKNLDGVNVDIENVSHLHRDAYTNFVKVLRSKIPDKILSVSVAANPNGWTQGWHGSYDYTQLANYSDYLMIMGYDESYYGGPEGPIASNTFAEKSITYALKYAPANKIVLGVPFFGRYWKEGDNVGGSGITSVDVNNLLEHYNTTKVYHEDKQSAQVYLTLTEGEVMPKLWGGKVLTPGRYSIWYDDIRATLYKLDLVEKYKLKGSGSWALGQEDVKIWSYYGNYKTSGVAPTPTPSPSVAPTPTPSPSVAPTPIPTKTKNPNKPRARVYLSSDWFTNEYLNESNIVVKEDTVVLKKVDNYEDEVIEAMDNVVTSNSELSDLTVTSEENKVTLDSGEQSAQTVTTEAYTETTGQMPFMGVSRTNLRTVDNLDNMTAKMPEQDYISKSEYNKNGVLTRGKAVETIMKMATLLPDVDINIKNFDDTKGHKYKQEILKAKYYGIIEARDANNFYPDEPITKEDLVMLMDRVFNLPDTVDFDHNEITDISMQEDPEKFFAINKYYEHEVIELENGKFNPHSFMTIREFTKIVAKMQGTGLKELEPILNSGQKQKKKILEPR